MYIIKNAYKSIIRGKGRNILIGIIVTVITIGTCIAFMIHKSGLSLVDTYTQMNPLEVTLELDTRSLLNATDSEKESFTVLDKDLIQKFGSSDYVKDYYYTNEISLSSDIEAVSTDELLKPQGDVESNQDNATDDFRNKFKMNIGDFRITGYSDASYIESFITGSSKIIEGTMFTKDVEEMVAVISSELADKNELSIGDIITFYDSSLEGTKYELKIVGIYTSESSDSDFTGMNAMNGSNQIYTNIQTVDMILENSETSLVQNRYKAYFYLEQASDFEAFQDELTEKGLNPYYTITTNQNELEESLTPIRNLSNFSFTFLIIIFIVGGIVLSIINMINIRERKYEIGVLRAIGMSKGKVALQLLVEIFMVACISILIGLGIGYVTAQPVTNTILKNEIESYQTKSQTIAENFGGKGFERPGFGGNVSNNLGNKMPNEKNVDYIDSLQVSLNFGYVLQIVGMEILLIGLSGFVCIMYINHFEPNKILQNR